MKKITLLALLAVSIISFAQQKSTGNVTLSSNMTANLTLNNTTSKATLRLTGPSDRWFALQFGAFGASGGMESGEDLVYTNATALIDANQNGVGASPSTDATQSWTVTSNTVASGIRTIIAERNFSTGDANDYTFNYNNATIDFAWARSGSASYGLSNHGGGNRGYNTSVALSTTLGIQDFSLNSSSIYPNPSNGNFNVETKTGLNQINVYSQLGALVETIDVKDNATSVEVSLKKLQKGVYLIELKKENDKTWKKIIIE